MKYFKIEKSLDPKIVGNAHNHSERMSPGYDYDASNSVYNWQKNNLTPNLKSVIVNRNAKITDLIDCIPIGGSGVIMSEKFFHILSWFNIMDYSLAEVELIKDDKTVPGFLFFYFTRSILDEDIEFSKSKYVNLGFDYEKGEYNELGELRISSLAELDEGRPTSQLRPLMKKLTLKKHFNYDVFSLDVPGRLIVTEEVKKVCEKEKVKGVVFTPFEALVRE